MTKALYPGRFDPVTNGHIDLISRATTLFDDLVVGVAVSSPIFPLEERLEFIRESTARFANVHVKPFNGLTTEFAREVGASVLVRGIRGVTDFETEFDMALMYRKMAPEIECVYLMTSLEHLFVSASRIREVASLGFDVSELVPSHVAEALRKKYGVS
ncbi:MAG TPA: pantetheine-phosphate adenylyltransferase [Dehalococcoidia bacterium]|nr:pantetheine-phosphate adenylyltransferase [Dehalococcoidia bacterium]